MLDNKVKFQRKLVQNGNSDAVNLPEELLTFIGANRGDELTIIADVGKHGKFIAIFKE